MKTEKCRGYTSIIPIRINLYINLQNKSQIQKSVFLDYNFFFFAGLVLTSGIVSASPFPQQPENQAKGEEIIFKRAPQNKQNEHQKQSQAQRSFQQAQLRSSLSSEGYDRPPADDEFEYSSDEYANPGFQSASSGFNRRLFRPSGNREFDSFDRREFDYGNRPAFGGWKKPTRPKPVWSTSDREFGISNGVGVPGANSLDEPTSNDRRQSGSNAVDDQQGSSIGGSGNDNRGSGTLGGSTSVNENRPQSVGGLPWTTVRSPVNRIFVDYTVPEAECIRKCPSLSQYDPICGTDNITYTNRAKFQCAQECGRGKNFTRIFYLFFPAVKQKFPDFTD